MTNDFEELRQAKAQCLDDLRTHLPDYANRLNSIDPRLMAYVEDAISNDGSHANLYELLGIRKELRLMDSYDMDPERVQRHTKAIEGQWKNGRHVKGGLKFDTPRGNQHVRLMPYQVWCLFGIYAFKVDVDMERRYVEGDQLLPTEWVRDGEVWDTRRLTDECHLFQTRKSGKTEFGGAIDFTEVCFLGPANGQALICAPSSEQSKIAYKAIREFAMQVDPTCVNRMGGKYFRMTRNGLNWQPGHRMKGEIKTMAAGKVSKDGLYASVVHADEHGQPGYVNGHCDMQSAVETCWGSTGPRREKLLMHTTTAGKVKDGPYKTKLEQAIEPSLLHELNYPLGQPHRTPDDSWFAFLLRLDPWEVTEDLDKLDDPELFRKVNRSIGTTVQPDYYRKRLHEASQSEDTKQEVLTKDFNMWQTGRVTKWITGDEMRHLQVAHRIDDCTKAEGWVVFTGLDFSLGGDWNGPGWLAARRHPSGRGTEFFADCDVWISEEEYNDSPLHPLYEQWVKGGWMNVSPGKTFQPELFVGRLDELIKKGVQFMFFGYDKYKSKVPINVLKSYLQATLGIQNPEPYVQVVSQLNSEFNGPTEDLYNIMFAPVPFITYSNSPLWPFCFNNAMLETDNRENKRPVKANQSASCKIDPIQCIIMALDLYERYEGARQ
ncbi:MAG: hypothetical protein IKF14_05445 [Atopobiaceae bacterium]|nr:hypothetical protein [Atopobiaceae bacterium]